MPASNAALQVKGQTRKESYLSATEQRHAAEWTQQNQRAIAALRAHRSKEAQLDDLLQRYDRAFLLYTDLCDKAADAPAGKREPVVQKVKRAYERMLLRCIQHSELSNRPENAVCPQCRYGGQPPMTETAPLVPCLEHAAEEHEAKAHEIAERGGGWKHGYMAALRERRPVA